MAASPLEIPFLLGDGAFAVPSAPASSPESLCLTHPEEILTAHQSYVAAGANCIRTQSLRANPIHLRRIGLGDHVNEINWTAAQLARQSIGSTSTVVAGTVGPAPASEGLDEELVRDAFREQIGALLDGRVDLILLQGFHSVEQLVAAVEIKHELHHCPVIATIRLLPSGHVPDGIHWVAASSQLIAPEVDAVGFEIPVHQPPPSLPMPAPPVPTGIIWSEASSDHEVERPRFADRIETALALGCKFTFGGPDDSAPEVARARQLISKSLEP